MIVSQERHQVGSSMPQSPIVEAVSDDLMHAHREKRFRTTIHAQRESRGAVVVGGHARGQRNPTCSRGRVCERSGRAQAQATHCGSAHLAAGTMRDCAARARADYARRRYDYGVGSSESCAKELGA